MPTSVELLLLDTSAALAFIQRSNPFHEWVDEVTSGKRLGLSGHAHFETYSVLTRLPSASRLSSEQALRVIAVNFPDSRFLDAEAQAGLLREFGDLGIKGGSVYDALVAAAARAHRARLVTCDLRALVSYRLLESRVLAPPAG